MKCDQVMTKDPVFCLANDTVVKASQLMKSNDIGSVPVVDSKESKKDHWHSDRSGHSVKSCFRRARP